MKTTKIIVKYGETIEDVDSKGRSTWKRLDIEEEVQLDPEEVNRSKSVRTKKIKDVKATVKELIL